MSELVGVGKNLPQGQRGEKRCEAVRPGGQESSGELELEGQVMSFSTQEYGGGRVLQGEEAV